MLLYATTTSERASKGQGGNKYLIIKIQAGNERKTLSTIEVSSSKSSNGVEIFTAYAGDTKIGEIIEIPKGKQNILDYSKTPTKQLEKELKELQLFLSEDTSSTSRKDYLIESAMIEELNKRKGKQKKGEPDKNDICKGCGYHITKCKCFDNL